MDMVEILGEMGEVLLEMKELLRRSNTDGGGRGP